MLREESSHMTDPIDGEGYVRQNLDYAASACLNVAEGMERIGELSIIANKY